MTTITKPYNSFLDDRDMTLVKSPNGKIHVEDWYSKTVCGRHVYFGYAQWEWYDRCSLRYVGKIAKTPNPYGRWCLRCLKQYKDVNIDD